MTSAVDVEVPRKIRNVLGQEAYCGGAIAVVVEQEPPIRESTRGRAFVVTLFEGDRVVERRHTTRHDLVEPFREAMLFDQRQRCRQQRH